MWSLHEFNRRIKNCQAPAHIVSLCLAIARGDVSLSLTITDRHLLCFGDFEMQIADIVSALNFVNKFHATDGLGPLLGPEHPG